MRKAHGYDHDFLFNNIGLDNKNFVLESKDIILDVRSDYESCQIYTCNYEDKHPILTSDKDIYQGIAIEPQDSLLNRRIHNCNLTNVNSIRLDFVLSQLYEDIDPLCMFRRLVDNEICYLDLHKNHLLQGCILLIGSQIIHFHL